VGKLVPQTVRIFSYFPGWTCSLGHLAALLVPFWHQAFRPDSPGAQLKKGELSGESCVLVEMRASASRRGRSERKRRK